MKNNIIQEDYVSFEVAKLLKDKGFDVPCIGRYSVRSKEFHLDCTRLCNNGGLFEFSAPTLQMAMKWLREEHKIFIAQEFGWFHCDYEYQASVKKMNPTIPPTLDSIICIKAFRNESYEIACEKSIKYCLTYLI